YDHTLIGAKEFLGKRGVDVGSELLFWVLNICGPFTNSAVHLPKHAGFLPLVEDIWTKPYYAKSVSDKIPKETYRGMNLQRSHATCFMELQIIKDTFAHLITSSDSWKAEIVAVYYYPISPMHIYLYR
ncbi:hypothetical protein ACJX0J_010374, partial [Zea mays]